MRRKWLADQALPLVFEILRAADLDLLSDK
jgi:hypothetical protein